MKPFLSLLLLLTSFTSFSQEEEEYSSTIIWTEGAYVKSTSDMITPLMKDISVLMVDGKPNSKNLLASLKNNPQFIEVQLEQADQQLLNDLFALEDSQLQAIIVESFRSSSCYVPVCKIKTLWQLQLHSKQCTTLEFAPNGFEAMEILNVDMDNLTSWNGKLESKTLGLLDVSCLKLKTIPEINTPHLNEYSISTSAPFPTNICEMPNLESVYISTTGEGKLAPCHEELLKTHLGLLEFITFSEDDDKRTTIKSEATLQFEKEMQEAGQMGE